MKIAFCAKSVRTLVSNVNCKEFDDMVQSETRAQLENPFKPKGLFAYNRRFEGILFGKIHAQDKLAPCVGRLLRSVNRDAPFENIVMERLDFRHKVEGFLFELGAFLSRYKSCMQREEVSVP